MSSQPAAVRSDRTVAPLRRRTQLAQLLALLPLRGLAALRGITWLMLASTVLAAVTAVPWIVAFPLWLVVPMTIALVLPPGRMALAALLLDRQPTWTPAQVRAAIVGTARDVGAAPKQG